MVVTICSVRQDQRVDVHDQRAVAVGGHYPSKAGMGLGTCRLVDITPGHAHAGDLVEALVARAYGNPAGRHAPSPVRLRAARVRVARIRRFHRHAVAALRFPAIGARVTVRAVVTIVAFALQAVAGT